MYEPTAARDQVTAEHNILKEYYELLSAAPQESKNNGRGRGAQIQKPRSQEMPTPLDGLLHLFIHEYSKPGQT